MKCIYLGRSGFTSKKGTACFTVNFGVPFRDNKGEGFRACNFFIDANQFSDFKSLSTPCSLECDIRFINGSDALIGYDISSESIDLWD